MANQTKSTSLQQVLKSGTVYSTLFEMFKTGKFDDAKSYIETILHSGEYHFDSKEPDFVLNFISENTNVEVASVGNKLVIKDKNQGREETSLKDKIQNGHAPIDDIRRALLDGSLSYEDFKEAVEHPKHNSSHYKLLLLNENKVYETEKGVGIKVQSHDSALYATQEKQHEKEEREKYEQAKKKEAALLTPEEMKRILLGMPKPITFDQQVKNDRTVFSIISCLSMITDPEDIKLLVGEYKNLGIYITQENGTLTVQDRTEVIQQMRDNIEAKNEYDESKEKMEEAIDKKVITAMAAGANPLTIAEMSIKKDEFDVYLSQEMMEGREVEEITKEFYKNEVSTITVDNTPTAIEVDVPREDITLDGSKYDGMTKEQLIAECKKRILQGVSPEVLKRNGAENPAAYKIIKGSIGDIINPYNYPDLSREEIANAELNEVLTIQPGIDEHGNNIYVPVHSPIRTVDGPSIKHRIGEN